ncbi:MAG: holo-ACP synthase [Akkermansiaceae bacterium]|jgi:holo-[acyl-carrier protein] synthase|nr:holo-ACP synthase [Akkermansiaceae bacterium]
MTIHGIGVDVVEVERVASALTKHGGAFMAKVFTAGECRYCEGRTAPAPHFAARFAAKEAVAKAFGTGIGARAGWRDIEVVHSPAGAPAIRLHGAAAAFAATAGITGLLLSLSHSKAFAVASAVAVKG